MTNPTPPNQRHHGASASPPSMPTPPTEASLSAVKRFEAAFDKACSAGDEYGCDFRDAWKVVDTLTTENATLTARVSALTEALLAYDEWVIGHNDEDETICFLCHGRGTVETEIEHKEGCPEPGRFAALRGDTGGER